MDFRDKLLIVWEKIDVYNILKNDENVWIAYRAVNKLKFYIWYLEKVLKVEYNV